MGKYSKILFKIIKIYIIAGFVLFCIFVGDTYFHFLDLIFGPDNVEGWGYGFGIYLILFGLPILLLMLLILAMLILSKK